jgi:hypothetical protein
MAGSASLVSVLAVAAAAGCGDDKDDGDTGGEAGEGNSGGSSAGTKNNTSGSANKAGDTGSDGGMSPGGGGVPGGGGSPDEGGSGPGVGGAVGGGGTGEGGTVDSGGAGPDPFGGASSGGAASGYEGPPIAKFCNTLTFGTEEDPMPTTMRLEIGIGNDMVSFTASTDECVPIDGAACSAISTGAAVLVQLFDTDDDTLPVDTATIEILEDEQLLFFTDIADENPIWDVRTIKPTFACEDITYDDVLAIE